MSTLANIDFRVPDSEIIDLVQRRGRSKAVTAGLTGHRRGTSTMRSDVRDLQEILGALTCAGDAADTVVRSSRSSSPTPCAMAAARTCTLGLTAHPDSIEVAVHSRS